ncbi:Serine/threonine protein kinase [Minicystis rosea]|nr:Serine/threonine protein kinase [Minicystis rosea]
MQDAGRLVRGTKIERRYELTKLIAEGGFGEVWRARDTRFEAREVAVKLLRSELGRDAETVARFEREADLLAAVSHPAVVSVLDRGKAGARRYFVMEHVDGVSLARWMKAKKGDAGATMAEALALFDALCAGVAAAHAVAKPGPIVHRDIKPANVMVRAQKGSEIEVKLLDFGCAQVGARTRVRGAGALGTLTYMAPEQTVHRKASLGPWTDVFALGVVLTEVLTKRAEPEKGRPWGAWVGANSATTRARLAELGPHVPSAVWDVVAVALAPRIEDRFADASVLRAALRAAWPGGTSRPALALVPPAKPTTPKRRRRKSAGSSRPSDPLGALASVVADLLGEVLVGELEFVIVEVVSEPDYYVQFASSNEGLLAETVSNAYLPKEKRFSAATRKRLSLLGWTSPDPSGEAANHQRFWPDPSDLGSIAAIAVRTLSEIHGVTGPDDVRINRDGEEDGALASDWL